MGQGELKPGDLVALKIGSPCMLVLPGTVSAGRLHCLWVTRSGEIRREEVEADLLVPWRPELSWPWDCPGMSARMGNDLGDVRWTLTQGRAAAASRAEADN